MAWLPNFNGIFSVGSFRRSLDDNLVSDLKVVVSWVNNGDFGNIGCVNAIYDIRSAMRILGGVEVVYDSRAFNSFADSLAKMGSSERGDFVEWRDI
ncbi:hypothetical protein Ddye_001128 [Dipteronia dyeriana]|uniref:Uncharacterized protein n=1 Tax=Dipteronia dyeriana TaxID=168575 RepID=A0AAD9XN09_9ROSI|nr:hypothetical protein Ddye_001128 [Dipteronia dyeriana]